MTTDSLIEKVAEIIYNFQGGLSPEEFEHISDSKKRLWKTDKPWDSQPDVELCEWERDEYRVQAREVLKLLATSSYTKEIK